jgi:WXXGXW repeat (2 copies)
MFMLKKTLIATSLALLALGGAFTVPAQAQVSIRIGSAPPPPRVEVVPAPRRGYVWTAGHWEWQNRRHQWVTGSWMRERRGQHFVEPVWTENNGRWEYRRGSWARGDRDGDGVPNSMDRRPNNPNKS